VEQVNAAIAARHHSARAYALADRQGERLSRLFATDQVSMQLIHAASRPAPDTALAVVSQTVGAVLSPS
jgi:hypothetical protein